tara:strand:- start:189 stop:1241 length:1053 start_codon:yes stop_codon:yes gene_type:complete
MAYIGKSPQVGNYVKLDAITTSSTNTYNLTQDSVAFVPESALHMLVSLNGVIQSPLSSFSVSGSTITFLPSSGTLSSSDTIDFIMVLGNTLDIGTPSDSTVTNAKTNFVSTSSSAGLQIKGDGTTDGTLQLNCRANSHGIKLKSPPHSAGQSYTLTFPSTAPVADKALITDGSGNLSFGTAGSLVKLASTTVSSSTALVAFDNTIITSAYDNYYITLQNVIPVSSNMDLRARCSIDNGSNFLTHECSYNYIQLNGSNTGKALQTSIIITEDEDSNSGRGMNGDITLYGVNGSTTKDALSHGFTTNYGTTTHQYAYQGFTAIDTTSAINYIKIFGDHNIASGIFTIYGRVK